MTISSTVNSTNGGEQQESVRRELEVLLQEPPLDGSNRLKRFLQYVVDETLMGRAARLSGYTIALDVFDKPDDFDPALDSVVRVEASRLRRRLNQHYAETNRSPELRISLPKGTYVPEFERLDVRKAPVPLSGSAPRPERRGPAVAVLPFNNYSTSPEDRYFADGLTEETIANLSRFKGLFVLSRSTTSKLARDGADIRTLRDELGINFVIEGSVRRSRHKIRVTAQLIDAETDGHIFTESFDRVSSPEGLFEIQDEIALLVAARVGDRYGSLGRYLAKHGRTGTTRFWKTYDLIGQFFAYYANHDPELHNQVREGLSNALAEDTDSSDGWAALSIVLLDEYRLHLNERAGVSPLTEALDCALRAVAADPENAFAFHALAIAYFHCSEFSDFRISAERCLELNPGHTGALADIGTCYALCGDWDRGLDLVERAIELSPIRPGWFHFPIATKHMVDGDHQEALIELRKVPMVGFYWYHALRLCALAEAGQAEEASKERGELEAAYPEFGHHAHRELNLVGMHPDIAETFLTGWKKAGMTVSEPSPPET